MKKLVTLFVLSLVLVGCTNAKKSVVLGDQKAGESLAGWYYYHLMQDNFDSIPKLLETEDGALLAEIEKRKNELGKIESFKLKGWENTETNKKEKTKDFVIEYEVTYEKGKANEKLYLGKKGQDLRISTIEFE